MSITKDLADKKEFHKTCVLGEFPVHINRLYYENKTVAKKVMRDIRMTEGSYDFYQTPYLSLSCDPSSPYSVY